MSDLLYSTSNIRYSPERYYTTFFVGHTYSTVKKKRAREGRASVDEELSTFKAGRGGAKEESLLRQAKHPSQATQSTSTRTHPLRLSSLSAASPSSLAHQPTDKWQWCLNLDQSSPEVIGKRGQTAKGGIQPVVQLTNGTGVDLVS